MTLFSVSRMHGSPSEDHGEHASMGQSELGAMASLHVTPATLSQEGARYLNTRPHRPRHRRGVAIRIQTVCTDMFRGIGTQLLETHVSSPSAFH